MACINHNDITYRTLLELSGLTQLELDAKVRKTLETTGEYPFIEQVVSSDTIPALVKKYYGYDWIVPMSGECKYGETWGNMTLFKE